jgi:predicted hotdog family 3-hydroxylacyl-ACP dehydratase
VEPDVSCPSPDALLPHAPPMVLLDEVVGFDGDVVRCRRTVRSGQPFVVEGRLPALVGLELLAQAAAVHRALSSGGRAAKGVLVGAPRIDLHREAFRVDEVLDVEVRLVDAAGPLRSLDGVVRVGDEVAVSARLQVVETGERG